MIKYKYKSIGEFKKDYPTEYKYLHHKGWVEKICEDVGWKYRVVKPKNYWTKERCIEEALKYKVKEHWVKNSKSSYNAAKKNGWYYECIAHIVPTRKPNGYWTKERCLETAFKYDNKQGWKKNNPSANGSARKNGWFEECIAHMKKK
jgi:hypothetical protein